MVTLRSDKLNGIGEYTDLRLGLDERRCTTQKNCEYVACPGPDLAGGRPGAQLQLNKSLA